MSTSRAHWTPGTEKGLVDLLQEYNVPRWRGQNGWSAEGWNKITKVFNEKFPHIPFTKPQIKEHEKELKYSYKIIKELKSKTGVCWDPIRFMISASDEVWKELIEENPKVKKWQYKPFPLFDTLAFLYEGSIAEGRRGLTSIQLDCIEVDDNEADKGFELSTEYAEEPHIVMPPATSSPPPPSSQAPQRNQIPECSSSLQTNRKIRKTTRDMKANTTEGYMDLKRAKLENGEQSLRRQDDFSIPRCIEIVNNVGGFTEDEVVIVSEAFHDLNNREVFLSFSPRFRHAWMRRQISKLS